MGALVPWIRVSVCFETPHGDVYQLKKEINTASRHMPPSPYLDRYGRLHVSAFSCF